MWSSPLKYTHCNRAKNRKILPDVQRLHYLHQGSATFGMWLAGVSTLAGLAGLFTCRIRGFGRSWLPPAGSSGQHIPRPVPLPAAPVVLGRRAVASGSRNRPSLRMWRLGRWARPAGVLALASRVPKVVNPCLTPSFVEIPKSQYVFIMASLNTRACCVMLTPTLSCAYFEWFSHLFLICIFNPTSLEGSHC